MSEDKPNLITEKESLALGQLSDMFPSVDISLKLQCVREAKCDIFDAVTLLTERIKEKEEKQKVQDLRNSLQNSQSAKLKELALLSLQKQKAEAVPIPPTAQSQPSPSLNGVLSEKEKKLEQLKKTILENDRKIKELAELKQRGDSDIEKSQTLYNDLLKHNQSVLASNNAHAIVNSLRDTINREIISKSVSANPGDSFARNIKRNLALSLLEEAEDVTITGNGYSNKPTSVTDSYHDFMPPTKPFLFANNAYADSNAQPHSVIKSQHSGLFPEPFPESEKEAYSNGAENNHEHGSNGIDKKPLLPPNFPPYAMPPYAYYPYPPMMPYYAPYGMPAMSPLSPYANASYPPSPYAQPYRSPMMYSSYADLNPAKPSEPSSASSASDAYPSPQPSRPTSSHAPYSPAPQPMPYGYPPHPFSPYSRDHTPHNNQPQKQRQPIPFNPKQEGV